MRSAIFGVSLLAATPAVVLANQGWYLGLEGGANFLRDQTFRLYGADQGLFQASDGTAISEVSFDTGYVAGLVSGYAFGFGLRTELELARRDNDFDQILLLQNGQPSQRVGGREFADAAFGNLWYDFFPSSRLHPYIGGGAGIARVAVRDPAVGNAGLFMDGSNLRSDFDAVFVWQAGGGLRYDLSRHWTASVDYRYLRSNVGHFDLLENNPNSHVRTRYQSHAALFSIRYHFGAPPEAPVVEAPTESAQVVPVDSVPEPVAEAVPEPVCQPPLPGAAIDLDGCKVGDVIVLRGVNFAFDKATLMIDAKVLLDGVAAALARQPDIKVALQGHTDSRGSDAYNLRLSDQRAKAVRDYLISRGIDGGRMTAAGFGETMPVADNATDDGRELNRRVELKVVERTGSGT